MATDTSICNLALAYLGVLGNPISNLQSDSTPTAIKCRTVYDDIRQTVLRDHPWRFATKIKALSLLTDEEIIGWDFVYAYPSDCLNISRVFNESTLDTTPTELYEKMQRSDSDELIIVTDCENAYVKYTANVTNPSLFDPSFIDAFAWRLSVALAVPLTGEQAKQDSALNKYRLSIDSAKNANLAESNNPQETTSSFIETR